MNKPINQCEADSNSTETLVNFQQTTRLYIPEDRTLHKVFCKNIRSYKHNTVHIYSALETFRSADISGVHVASIFRVEERRISEVSRIRTPCTKMIDAVWKLIMFVNMLYRSTKTSRNERVILELYNILILKALVTRHTSRP
jgi:hypothetical protein